MQTKSHQSCAIINLLLVMAFISLESTCPAKGQLSAGTYYMANELNDVLCGFARITVYDSTINEQPVLVLRQSNYVTLAAMGRNFDQYQKFTYCIDPATGEFVYHDSYIRQPGLEGGRALQVEGETMRIITYGAQQDTIVNLPENALLPNNLTYNFLLNDFPAEGFDMKTYRIFDVRADLCVDIKYTFQGNEQLTLSGKTYDALVFTEDNPVIGLPITSWIDENSGMRLKMESQNHTRIYLTDASVEDNIKTGNFDDLFFISTNASVQDIHKISYMKVKGSMLPVPAVSMQDVNAKGQYFTGKITEEGLEGVFEIAYEKYLGEQAPSFPLDTNQYENMAVWLKPERLIESDDPELVALAAGIANGSADAWEAACRLSRWVDDHIDGSILSGSARETYDRRNGLCGSQSLLLTALCRSVGIPARVVWGCVYTPEMGGSFGHHAWNEIFMGDDGWIPVDATLYETDYVNSGHVRLGVLLTSQTVINFKEMEILEYKNIGSIRKALE